MRVGDLARRTNVTPKAIRYYDKLGLINARRTPSGYREFDEHAVEIVYAIRRAQLLGLQMNDIREIVDLLKRGEQPCGRVQTFLREKQADVAQRLRELKAFERFLGELQSMRIDSNVKACQILARVTPQAVGQNDGRRQSPRAISGPRKGAR